MRTRVCIVIILWHLCSFFDLAWSTANATEADDPYSMDLGELQMVTVASKRVENITDAPGVITVITADEIRRFGGRTLGDILQRATSIHPIALEAFGASGLSLRGSMLFSTTDRVLILLNGRPVCDSYLGGIFFDFFTHFPIDAIDRIEIIRGPGSVLYGTNAMAGVIDIRTKSEKDDSRSVSYSYGSFDAHQVGLHGALRLDERDRGTYAAGNYIDSQGWDYQATDSTGTSGRSRYFDHGYNVFLRRTFSKLEINAMLSQADALSYVGSFTYPLGDVHTDRQFVDLGYKQEISDTWNLQANLTLNGFEYRIEENNRSDSIGYLPELSLSGAVTETINLLTGITFEQLVGDIYTFDNVPGGGTVQKKDPLRQNARRRLCAGRLAAHPSGETSRWLSIQRSGSGRSEYFPQSRRHYPFG